MSKETITPKELAQVILLAAKKREESYVGEYPYYEYNVSFEACKEALQELDKPVELWYPIHLALFTYLKDALQWANDIVDGKTENYLPKVTSAHLDDMGEYP